MLEHRKSDPTMERAVVGWRTWAPRLEASRKDAGTNRAVGTAVITCGDALCPPLRNPTPHGISEPCKHMGAKAAPARPSPKEAQCSFSIGFLPVDTDAFCNSSLPHCSPQSGSTQYTHTPRLGIAWGQQIYRYSEKLNQHDADLGCKLLSPAVTMPA